MNPSAIFVTTVATTLAAFLVPFADDLRTRGWRVDALANGATANREIAGFFDERFDIGWGRNPLDPRNVLGTASRVRAVVRAGGYDIVHVHTPIAAFVTRYALRHVRERGGPLVIYTAHGFHFYEGQPGARHAVYRTMERAAARWTDYLVTINDEDHAAALALGTIPADRVRCIPGIGVDTTRYSRDAVTSEQVAAVRTAYNIPADAFLVTMVAELAPVKRHALALDALARVRDARVVLALVGSGPLEREIRSRVEWLGLAGRVRFFGYRPDVPAVFAASDAALLVSEREGLARSVLEAMACGLPVIGTDTRGIADAVGDAGWIVDKNDAAALAAAIDAAAGDPEMVARLGRAARRRAVDEFALPRVIAAYEELYREALASRV